MQNNFDFSRFAYETNKINLVLPFVWAVYFIFFLNGMCCCNVVVVVDVLWLFFTKFVQQNISWRVIVYNAIMRRNRIWFYRNWTLVIRLRMNAVQSHDREIERGGLKKRIDESKRKKAKESTLRLGLELSVHRLVDRSRRLVVRLCGHSVRYISYNLIQNSYKKEGPFLLWCNDGDGGGGGTISFRRMARVKSRWLLSRQTRWVRHGYPGRIIFPLLFKCRMFLSSNKTATGCVSEWVSWFNSTRAHTHNGSRSSTSIRNSKIV